MNLTNKLLVAGVAIVLVGGGATAGALAGHAAAADRSAAHQSIQHDVQTKVPSDRADENPGAADGPVSSGSGSDGQEQGGAISADELGPDDEIVDGGFSQDTGGQGVSGAPGTDSSGIASAH